MKNEEQFEVRIEESVIVAKMKRSAPDSRNKPLCRIRHKHLVIEEEKPQIYNLCLIGMICWWKKGLTFASNLPSPFSPSIV